jgi:hypothetical protein
VITAMSLVRQIAGSGRPCGGFRYSEATSCASVLLPPLPNDSSLRPALNAAAIAAAHSASFAPSRRAISSRSATISVTFCTVESRTWASTASRSVSSA